jgi:hypothetical protein
MGSPEFVLSTLHPVVADEATPAATAYVPRARYCVFRGMWAELPENKHNKATMNPRVYESELPTCTTDVRMQKVEDIFSSSKGRAEKASQMQGSGGGGPVEAVWWIKEVGTQWRMRGEAFVVGPDIESGEVERSGARTVKSEVGRRMRVVSPGQEGEWSWEKELTAHFGNNSPAIRGSFRAPPPGQAVGQPFDERLKLGEGVDDLEDEVARQNFRVVVIRPSEVEQLDLSDPKTARRYTFSYDDSTGKWNSEERWP